LSEQFFFRKWNRVPVSTEVHNPHIIVKFQHYKLITGNKLNKEALQAGSRMVVSENNVTLVRVLGLPDHILIALLEQNRAGGLDISGSEVVSRVRLLDVNVLVAELVNDPGRLG
jgi:hypothetical protein